MFLEKILESEDLLAMFTMSALLQGCEGARSIGLGDETRVVVFWAREFGS